MSALALLAAAQTLAVLALITVVLQWLWARRRFKRSMNEGIRRRLETRADLGVETAARVTVTPLESVLIRADIHLSQGQLTVFGLIVAVFLLVVLVLNGPLVALITAGLIAIALWMYWRFRFQQQRNKTSAGQVLNYTVKKWPFFMNFIIYLRQINLYFKFVWEKTIN